MKNKFCINNKFINLDKFIKSIQEHFKNGNTIHKARNEIKVINYENQDFVVKSFKVPHFLNKIIYSFFRSSKAKRSFEYSIRIEEFVPKAIGYIEFYENYFIKDSYFISEKFDYTYTAKELFFSNIINREEVIKEFAKFTYDLHENEIYHLDYSPGNILIKEDNGQYIFKIVDINRMKFFKPNIDLRMKNFSKLWAKDEDLILIAKEYAKILKMDENIFVEKILEYTEKDKKRKEFIKKLKGRC
ncbi:hypothetical protein [Arcobacter porcinus]|uniref:hypothetical protein n=1 Tax=Arcobacter porcinus TaxID=1935204 RepID=UPI0008240DFF|nr:hypothetical protein [Arcobacter porcinus]OCL83691.1 hypothetical protein AAW30_00933 [Arcobacter porcinus]OCL85822.1 hypothetical protein AAX30_01648 [Arcobacter porcinus]